ncbi:MAG TPA: hypothetical protein VFC21_11975 [Bryobacteraceae bacterium]|nr:hypothetical protein [Bryobacteraceae bacterium]
MAFVKGTPKPPGSGRKKGQVCRLAADVRSKLQELGCDPIEGLARLAMDPDSERPIVARCLTELAQYVYPKRRAIEISGIDGAAIEVNDNSSAIESLKTRIDGIASRIGTRSTT